MPWFSCEFSTPDTNPVALINYYIISEENTDLTMYASIYSKFFPLYGAYIQVSKNHRDTGIGITSWLQAERAFQEQFPHCNRLTIDLCDGGWTSRHFPEITSMLQQAGYTTKHLWNGSDGGYPAWIWSATR